MSNATPSVLDNLLWAIGLIAGCGAVGKFVDFYIGKAGRERVKDWMLSGWVRFDDMKWSNFSEKEALAVVAIFDRLFGKRLLSRRRILSTIAIYIFIVVAFSALAALTSRPDTSAWLVSDPHPIDLSIEIMSGMIAFATSISLSRAISISVARLSARSRLGPLLYLALVLIHCILFVVWAPVIETIVFRIVQTIELTLDGRASEVYGLIYAQWIIVQLYFADNSQQALAAFHPVDIFVDTLSARLSGINPIGKTFVLLGYVFEALFVGLNGLALLANVLRIAIAAAMLFAFLFRQWLIRFASRIWVRIYEDNDGTFTLVLGGIGAVAAGLKLLLGHP